MCSLEKRGNIFFLTLTGDDEHRLNPNLVDSIRSALSQAKSQATPGSVLVTSAAGKFFSNGLDIAGAQAAGSLSGFTERLSNLVECFKPLVADLLSLPMPTIAAVTGHAAAAGFLLALSHDYITMRSDRGVLYFSEVDIGLTFPKYFTALVRSKIGSAAARRDVLLGAAKLRAEEAVRFGFVESAHDGVEATVAAAVKLAEKFAGKKWNGDVYAEIRKATLPEICGELGLVDKAIIAPRL